MPCYDDDGGLTSSPLSMPGSCADIHQRVGHVVVGCDRLVLVWGGYTEPMGPSRLPSYYPPSQLLAFDAESEAWYELTTAGQLPPPLCGATAACYAGAMYVFGGFTERAGSGRGDGDDPTYANVGSLYRLDLNSLLWRRLQPVGLPPLGCDKLASWMHAGQMYVLGGFGSWPAQEAGEYGHVTFRVDATAWDRRGWNDQLVRYDVAENRWEWPDSSGVAPGPRAAHAATLAHDGRVYVFGGRMGRRLNDLYSLDLLTMHWRKHHDCCDDVSEGAEVPLRPQRRSWHSLSPIGSGRLLLYGGFTEQHQPLADPWLFLIDEDRWLPATGGCLVPVDPPPRMWHAAAPTLHGEVLLVGGLETSVFSQHQHFATDIVLARCSPKPLRRICLDAVKRYVMLLIPSLDTLPAPLLSSVLDRLYVLPTRSDEVGGS